MFYFLEYNKFQAPTKSGLATQFLDFCDFFEWTESDANSDVLRVFCSLCVLPLYCIEYVYVIYQELNKCQSQQ